MKHWFLLLGIFLAGCAVQAAQNVPELLVPISVQNDTFIVDRGTVARFDQHRGFVRVESQVVFFTDNSLPFGGFNVVAGQEVRQGDVLATLHTGGLEDRIAAIQERIADLQVEHTFHNQQLERAISIARLELSALENTDSQEAGLKRLEIDRMNMDLRQAREWQAFTLSYYQSELNEIASQMANAELLSPIDGVIVYRADILQGTFLDSFRPIVYISDGEQLFVEYSGLGQFPIFRGGVVQAVVEDRVYYLERISFTHNEALFFARDGGTVPVRFTFVCDVEDIRVGQFVSIMVYNEASEETLRIPPNALFFDAGLGHYVYVMDNGQRELQLVEVGVRARAWIEIISGLWEGAEILVQQ